MIPAVIAGFASRVVAGVSTGLTRLGGASRLTSSLTGRRAAFTTSGRGGGPKRGQAATSKTSGGKTSASPADVAQRESTLEKLWKWDSGLNLYSRLNTLVSENTSSFVHTINVSVIGGPNADLRRCWYLACAAAFGRYRNRVRGVGAGSMEATWDVTGKAVMVSIGYVNSGLLAVITSLSNRVKRETTNIVSNTSLARRIFGGSLVPIGLTVSSPAPSGSGRTVLDAVPFMQVGPDQVTVGGGWPDWLEAQTTAGRGDDAIPPAGGPVNEFCTDVDRGLLEKFVENPTVDVLGELPTSTGVGVVVPWGRVVPQADAGADTFSVRTYDVIGSRSSAVALPDDGRIITTGEKRDPRVQPVRPVVDGKSRTSILAAVHAALHQPCTAPEPLPCSESPLFSGGVFLYKPGDALSDNDEISRRDFSKAVASARRPFTKSPLNATEPRLVE